MSSGEGRTSLGSQVVQPYSTQPDLEDLQTGDDIEANGDVQDQGLPVGIPQVEPTNEEMELPQLPATDFTTTLLADNIFEALARTDYDPFWMRNTGLDPSILAEWTSHQISRYKIGQFFSAVFKTGDIFRLPVVLEGKSVAKTAVVSAL